MECRSPLVIARRHPIVLVALETSEVKGMLQVMAPRDGTHLVRAHSQVSMHGLESLSQQNEGPPKIVLVLPAILGLSPSSNKGIELCREVMH